MLKRQWSNCSGLFLCLTRINHALDIPEQLAEPSHDEWARLAKLCMDGYVYCLTILCLLLSINITRHWKHELFSFLRETFYHFIILLTPNENIIIQAQVSFPCVPSIHFQRRSFDGSVASVHMCKNDSIRKGTPVTYAIPAQRVTTRSKFKIWVWVGKQEIFNFHNVYPSARINGEL